MSLPERMERRRREDREMEVRLGIKKNDPYGQKIGRSYSPADIEKLEEERVPWLRARRRALREGRS